MQFIGTNVLRNTILILKACHHRQGDDERGIIKSDANLFTRLQLVVTIGRRADKNIA